MSHLDVRPYTRSTNVPLTFPELRADEHLHIASEEAGRVVIGIENLTRHLAKALASESITPGQRTILASALLRAVGASNTVAGIRMDAGIVIEAIEEKGLHL